MTKSLLTRLTVILFLWATGISAQKFYHNEDFFLDSAFIIKNNIKVVSIRIPNLAQDTTKEYYTYQRICYNPFGKMAWYEFHFLENNMSSKFYTWHFYDESARRTKTRIFQRCMEIDSLREQATYMYDNRGKLVQENHYQVFIGAYNDWGYEYQWQGDSLKIRIDAFENHDTTYIDKYGRETEFTVDNWRHKVVYDEKGRKAKTTYYWSKTKDSEEGKIDELTYHYDAQGRLSRIESMTRNVVFQFNAYGLPTSSRMYDKFNNEPIGHEMLYEYEYRETLTSSKEDSKIKKTK